MIYYHIFIKTLLDLQWLSMNKTDEKKLDQIKVRDAIVNL